MKYQMPPGGTQYRSIEEAPAELTKEWYITLSHLLTLILIKYGPIYIPREDIEKDNGKFRVFLTDDKTGYTIHLEKDITCKTCDDTGFIYFDSFSGMHRRNCPDCRTK